MFGPVAASQSTVPALEMGPSPWDDVNLVLEVSLLAFMLIYVLLQKKKLPQQWWYMLTRIYFYPMMLPNYLWRLWVVRGTYFSPVDDTLLLGAVPLVFAGHVKKLHEQGVRGVVNLMAEYEGPKYDYASCTPPIEQIHLPVIDHMEPSDEQLDAAVEFIARHKATGAKVLVHCKGGHGRSAAAAFAWLLSEAGGGLTPEAAQELLNSVRHVRKKLYLQPGLLAFWRKSGGKGSAMPARSKASRLHML